MAGRPKKYNIKENGKKDTGRPRIYDIDFCLNEIKYLYDRLMKDGETGKQKIITLHDLIKGRGYSRQRISEWGNEFKHNEEFSDTYKSIFEELENRLFKYGLTGKAAAMVIFGLKNNYGWKDKHETDVNIEGGVQIILQKRETSKD